MLVFTKLNIAIAKLNGYRETEYLKEGLKEFFEIPNDIYDLEDIEESNMIIAEHIAVKIRKDIKQVWNNLQVFPRALKRDFDNIDREESFKMLETELITE